MSKMKDLDIKLQNMDTEDLIAYVIRADYVVRDTGNGMPGDSDCVNEIIDNLRTLDGIRARLMAMIKSLDSNN